MTEPLGVRLRQARLARGLSQEKAAGLIQATRGEIIRWEQGKHVPRPERRRQLETLYNAPTGSLEPLEAEDEETVLLREAIALLDRLVQLHSRRASNPAGAEGGSSRQVAKEPTTAPY